MRVNKLFSILILNSILQGYDPCPYPAISYDSSNGSASGLQNFQKTTTDKLKEINKQIEESISNVNKINNLQSVKFKETFIAQNLMSKTLAEMKKTNFLQEKQINIKKSKLDLQISKLNSQIIELELLLAQLKK